MADAQTNRPTSMRVRRRQGQRISKTELPKLKAAFLRHFAKYANVSGACRHVGIDRATVYQWQEHDEVFALQFKQAELDACDVLRREAFKRAVVGWDEPLVSAGKHVTNVHKKSDAVLLAMLKARVPEYREKLDITSGGEKVTTSAGLALADVLLSKLGNNPEARDVLAQALLDEAQRAGEPQ